MKTIIGLTGIYCCGKSTADKILTEDYNYFSIDVDRVGHVVLDEKKDILVNEFGRNILEKNKINRKALGKIVFNDKNKLELLNSIVHPEMVKKINKIIDETKEDKICINAALLFEMGLYKLCNKIIVVKTNFLNVVKRSKKRDNNSIFRVIKILLSQKVLSLAKIYSNNTEIRYINNDSTLEQLKKNLKQIL